MALMITAQSPASRRVQLWATEIQHIAEHVEMGQAPRLTIIDLHQISARLRLAAGILDAGQDPFQ